MVLVLTGCAAQEAQEESNTNNQEAFQEGSGTESEAEQVEEDPETQEEAPQEEIKEISIYVVDADTGEIVQKQVESGQVDEQFLWRQLQEANVLSREATLLSIATTEEGILLDVDANFGDYIRSMGTAGEIEILNCIVWTYIDAFGVEKVKITEEGNTLETGHQELTEYMGKDN